MKIKIDNIKGILYFDFELIFFYNKVAEVHQLIKNKGSLFDKEPFIYGLH